jgi:uncharacterized protein (DUF302 family)
MSRCRDSNECRGSYARRVDGTGITTLRCDDDVAQVLRRLVAEIEGRGLEICVVVDHNGDAADAGLDMADSKLVVFGHPRVQTPLMVAHPLIALDLPMKLLVWARADGAVLVSFDTADFLCARHGLTADEARVVRIVSDIAHAATHG